MLKQTTESPDRAAVLNMGDSRSLVELGTWKDILFEHSESSSLMLDMSWNLKRPVEIETPEEKGNVLFRGQDLRYEVELNANGQGRMAVGRMAYGFGGHTFSMKRQAKSPNKYILTATPQDDHSPFQFKRAPGRPWDLPAPVKCYGFPDQVKAYFQNAGFLADFELAFEELFSSIYYLGPLRDYPKRQYTWAGAHPADMGQRGEKVVDALLSSRDRDEKISRGKGKRRLTVEECVAQWLRELGLIHSFTVEQVKEGSNLYQVWVKKSPSSARVLITDVGFGVSRILPVLTLCYYVPEGSVVLMEQPEIHLHPVVQAGLADVFIDAIKTRNVQIILESHSELLLRRLQRRIAEEKLSPQEASLFFCRMQKGASVLDPLQLSLFGEIVNWPEGFFGNEMEELAASTEAKLNRKLRERQQ
jgi:hypothetical protein